MSPSSSSLSPPVKKSVVDACDVVDNPLAEEEIDDDDDDNDIDIKTSGEQDFAEFKHQSDSVRDVPKEKKDGTLVLEDGAKVTAALVPELIDENSIPQQQQQQQQPATSTETTNPADAVAVSGSSCSNIIPDHTNNGSAPNGDLLLSSSTATTATATLPDTKKKRYVTPKDFDLLKVIGMGAFGKVLQVRNKKNPSQILAMKVISKRLLRRKSGDYIDNVQAERNIMTKVRHPYIVTMHCSFQTKEKLFIIMDFLAGGELFLRLGREGIFLEKTAAFYLAEIILALDHLHCLGILHRDLKPENILMGSDGHVCLTDFGLAKDFSTNDGFQASSSNDDNDGFKALTICGTHEYMSPEMLARQGYGRASDYWSLGCIAYEMLRGLPPFESKQGAKDLFRKIMTEKVKMPQGSTAAACKLLKGLLNRDVQKRLGTAKSTMFEIGGVAGLKKQEFFKHIDWDKLEKKEIEPPAKFSVEGEDDLKHFHEEFTKMSIPRSVIMMQNENFKPHRVASEAFRGFSFIHEDFPLPERQETEEEAYWKTQEEDGQSESECASSKADFEVTNTEELQSAQKKRPQRKRKKKNNKAGEAATANTPAESQSNTPSASKETTPVPSEAGDINNDIADGIAQGNKDTTQQLPENGQKEEKPSIKDKVEKSTTSRMPLTRTPPPPPPQPVFTVPVQSKPKPAAKPATAWQTTTTTPAKSKQQLFSQQQQQQQRHVVGMAAPPGQTARQPVGLSATARPWNAAATPLPAKTGWGQSPQKTQQVRPGWGQPQQHQPQARPTPPTPATAARPGWGAPPAVNRTTAPKQQQQYPPIAASSDWRNHATPPGWGSRPSPQQQTAAPTWGARVVAPHVRRAPPPQQPSIAASSDWRKHSMSPHDSPGRKTLQAPPPATAWPTLGGPPLGKPKNNTNGKNISPQTAAAAAPPVTKLKGAWASRV